MKKIIVIGLAAFVVSLAAATGLGIILRKVPEPEATSKPAVAFEEENSGQSGPFMRPTVLETPAAGEEAPSSDRMQPDPDPAAWDENVTDLRPVAAEQPVDPAPAADRPEGEDIESGDTEAVNAGKAQYRQFAKIVASMKASQAAEIMAYLSDEQAEMILRSLGVRQVAALLAAMPIERAAALSKRLLERPTEEE